LTFESPSRRTATDAEAPARRDPARTRARLLEAAVAEFGDHGFSGARTDRIARNAGTNIRMLYHYFGSKDDLYVAVLEAVLADLRHDELQLDVDTMEPIEGLMCIFDFVENHFAAHPRLRKLLAFENLNEARHLAVSTRIPEMATPVLSRIRKLLARGAASGEVRAGSRRTGVSGTGSGRRAGEARVKRTSRCQRIPWQGPAGARPALEPP
jgi:AcrR family transcriptional regulator